MKDNVLGKRLENLRNLQNKNQREFAKFLGIPQSTLSAYENGINNPTIDILIKNADKCDVSLDWLVGKVNHNFTVSSMRDVVSFFYELSFKNEVGFKINIEDGLNNDVSIVFSDNSKYPLNTEIINILKELSNNIFDLDSYSITKNQFDILKNSIVSKYNQPLTNKERIAND